MKKIAAILGAVIFLNLIGCSRRATTEDVVGNWVSDPAGVNMTLHSDGSLDLEGRVTTAKISLSDGKYAGRWAFDSLGGKRHVEIHVDSSFLSPLETEVYAPLNIDWHGDSAVLYFTIGDPDDMNRVYFHRIDRATSGN